MRGQLTEVVRIQIYITVVHVLQVFVALFRNRHALMLQITARTGVAEPRNGMSSFGQIAAYPLCTLESLALRWVSIQ